MKLEIIFTAKAKDSLLATILFIQGEWGYKSAEKFTLKVYKTLDTIAQQPLIFKAYQNANVRKGIITKQTSVIYRVLHDKIEVLFFWDNRQEPLNDY